MQIENNMEGCLVIGISQSGQATDVIQLLTSARQSGAITACITNVAGSPICYVSDYTFLCHAGEELAVAATKTYTTALAVCALIAGTWSANESLLKELTELPEKMRKTLMLDNTISQATERYRYITECAVLARGLNQCTALEAALKLTETSYLVAKPYSGADFQHGPIAMISEGFPCFLFAPPGKALAPMMDLAVKLKAKSAEMVIISTDEQILELSAKPIEVPITVSEILSPLIYILPGQLWAYYLSRSRGHDPDKPRGLSKVTLTR